MHARNLQIDFFLLILSLHNLAGGGGGGFFAFGSCIFDAVYTSANTARKRHTTPR